MFDVVIPALFSPIARAIPKSYYRVLINDLSNDLKKMDLFELTEIFGTPESLIYNMTVLVRDETMRNIFRPALCSKFKID